ncbi:hypothetical protein AKJ16_DCAP23649 [Drosera capensis]
MIKLNNNNNREKTFIQSYILHTSEENQTKNTNKEEKRKRKVKIRTIDSSSSSSDSISSPPRFLDRSPQVEG